VKFFFGDKPSSVDAVLYPHLLYHHRSPVAAPELRNAVQFFLVPLAFLAYGMQQQASCPWQCWPCMRELVLCADSLFNGVASVLRCAAGQHRTIAVTAAAATTSGAGEVH
jgi:Glutathione S-transferase, C-terminal domain